MQFPGSRKDLKSGVRSLFRRNEWLNLGTEDVDWTKSSFFWSGIDRERREKVYRGVDYWREI